MSDEFQCIIRTPLLNESKTEKPIITRDDPSYEWLQTRGWLKGSLTSLLIAHVIPSRAMMMLPICTRRFGRMHDNRVIGMSLDVLLQVLRTLEGLSAKVTFMRLQGDMDANMGGDVVALDGGSPAIPPATSQVQVIRAFATYVTLADMLLVFEEVSQSVRPRIFGL